MKYTDRAFSLAKPLPKGAKAVGDIPVSFFTDALFGLDVSVGRGRLGSWAGGDWRVKRMREAGHEVGDEERETRKVGKYIYIGKKRSNGGGRSSKDVGRE